jgi:hypothetical protein
MTFIRSTRQSMLIQVPEQDCQLDSTFRNASRAHFIGISYEPGKTGRKHHSQNHSSVTGTRPHFDSTCKMVSWLILQKYTFHFQSSFFKCFRHKTTLYMSNGILTLRTPDHLPDIHCKHMNNHNSSCKNSPTEFNRTTLPCSICYHGSWFLFFQWNHSLVTILPKRKEFLYPPSSCTTAGLQQCHLLHYTQCQHFLWLTCHYDPV